MSTKKVIGESCYGSEVPAMISRITKNHGRPATVEELREWASLNPPVEGTTVYALGSLQIHNGGIRATEDNILRCKDVRGEVGKYSASKGFRTQRIVADRAGYLPGALFLVVEE